MDTMAYANLNLDVIVDEMQQKIQRCCHTFVYDAKHSQIQTHTHSLCRLALQ